MKLYVISGPNGAGKTTFAREFLPNYADCRNFVNADLIAQGMAPFSPETAALRAGRTMLRDIRSFSDKRDSFAFETTLSGRGYIALFRRLKGSGYRVHLFFLWLKDVDLAIYRVKERVSRGGHDVPEPVIRRRFDRSIENFFRYYSRLVDTWMLFDNSGASPALIASARNGRTSIINNKIYSALVKRYGRV